MLKLLQNLQQKSKTKKYHKISWEAMVIPNFFYTEFKALLYTVGKKSIRALEIFRVQKLILNATS